MDRELNSRINSLKNEANYRVDLLRGEFSDFRGEFDYFRDEFTHFMDEFDYFRNEFAYLRREFTTKRIKDELIFLNWMQRAQE